MLMPSKFSSVFVSNDAFKKYWHSLSPWRGYSIFFSVITALYLIQKITLLPLDELNQPVVVARLTISCVVLVLLPVMSLPRFKYFFVTATSVAFLACIINLEGVFARRQSFVSLYIMTVFFRTTRDHTFFDNFALCIAYSADVASITHRNLEWYISSNLALWIYFAVALFFNNLYKRLSQRVWEAIRLLIILREKTRREHERGQSLVHAHLPKDILEYVFSRTTADQMPTTVSDTMGFAADNQQPVDDCPHSDNLQKFIDATVRCGITTEFNPGVLSPQFLKSSNRVDKKNTVIIGAKVDKGNAKDCALAVDREHKVHQMLDQVAAKYQVTSIRRFGNTWIGTLGYFKSHSDDNVNSYQACLFCSEMDYIAKRMGMKLAIAVDFGAIVGGFVTSYQFDLFGQEIRWILKMIDLNDYGRIILSDSVRQLLNLYKRSNTGSNQMACFEKKTTEVNGKAMSYQLLVNPQELVKPSDINLQFDTFENDNSDSNFSEYFKNGAWTISFDPSKFKRSAETKAPVNYHPPMSGDSQSRLDTSKFTDDLAEYFRAGELVTLLDPDYWREDSITKDFQQSLLEKFDMNHDDPVLSKYTVDDLAATHQQIENEIYRELGLIFLPTLWLCVKSSLSPSWWFALFRSVWNDNATTSPSMSSSFDSIAFEKSSRAVDRDSMGALPVYYNPFQLYTSREWRTHLGSEMRLSLIAPLMSWFPPPAVKKYDPVPVLLSPLVDETPKEIELHTMSPVVEQSVNNALPSVEAVQEMTVSQEKEISWAEYATASKMLFHNTLLNFLVDALFFLACLYSIRASMVDGTMNSLFMNLIFVHFILAQTLERISPSLGSILLGILHCAIVMVTPDEMIHEFGHQGSKTFGDFGGDVSVLLFFAFRLPSHIHQTGLFPLLDLIVSRGILLVRSTVHSNAYLPVSGQLSTVLMLCLLVSCYITVEHRCWVAFVLERKLLPFAFLQQEKQLANSRELLRTFAPAMPGENDDQRGTLKWYRNSVIAVVHIKACDVISGLVEARDVAILVKAIGDIIDRSFQEFGMLKVTNFSGVHVAMMCRSMGKEGWDRSGASSSPHASHALYLLRTIQTRVEKFSKDYNFNVALGISLNQGSAYVGFLGNGVYCFDVAGPTRDMTVAMACHHGEGIFVPRMFEADIHRIIPSDDLVHHQKITDSSNPDSYWLMLDGNFSGMQLDDFAYVGMLGRGGYGSVHLVMEKNTNMQYAIKAIALRQGSVMSKMIKRECIILQRMNHRNVVNLKYSFISNNRLYLVMSFIKGGNMKQVLERASVEFSQLRYWFAELVLAIEYVHSVGIIHRDIKPANCMIGIDGHLKLGDFGLSKTIGNSKDIVTQDPRSFNALGFGRDVYEKLQNFLPLKSFAAEGPVERTDRHISVLVVKTNLTSSDNRKTLMFKNFQVEVFYVRTRADGEYSLSKNNIDAIFVEIADSEENSILEAFQLLQFFCTNLSNTIPVYLLSTPADCRQMFFEAGARDCFAANMDQLDEETLRRIFSIAAAMPQRDLQSPVTLMSPPRATMSNAGNSSASSFANAQGTGTTHTATDGARKGHFGETNIGATVANNNANLNNSRNNDSTVVHSKSADQDHIVGTLHFIAPEVIRWRKYGKSVDWWACGVTFFECAARQHLFKGDDKESIFESILSKVVDLSSLERFGEDFVSLVGGFVCHDVRDRLGSRGTYPIRNHSFFSDIDWETVSINSDKHFRPGQYLSKFDLKDKLQFYGETDGRLKQATSSQREMEQRNINSLRRYHINRDRLRNAKKKRKQGNNRSFHISQTKKLVSGQVIPERKPRKTSTNSSSFGASNSHSFSRSTGGESESVMFSYETLHEDDRENTEGDDELEFSTADAGVNNSSGVPLSDKVSKYPENNSISMSGQEDGVLDVVNPPPGADNKNKDAAVSPVPPSTELDVVDFHSMPELDNE